MACLHLVSLQGICDGAGAVVLSSEAAITQHGLKPLARLVDYSVTGVDPTIMGIGCNLFPLTGPELRPTIQNSS